MFRTLDGPEVEGKLVLVRSDLNAPVENGKVQDCLRFERYSETVEELQERGARVVVLAHQGRPDRDDFTALEQHAEILSENYLENFRYLDEIFSDHAIEKIRELDGGDALLLENVRFLSEELRNLSAEKHAESIFVSTLSPMFDAYVNDAFSAAHRPHASLMGFPEKMPAWAGRVMEDEVESLTRVSESMEKPEVLVLGGAKPEDIVKVIDSLGKHDEVSSILLGGLVGELALIARGHDLGGKERWMDERGLMEHLPDVRKVVKKYEDRICAPEDVALEIGGERKEFAVGEVPGDGISYDIGSGTVEKFRGKMEGAKEILMKGPMGMFERKGFGEGTEEIMRHVSESGAFTVIGGGHTSSLIRRYGMKIEDFSHVSVAGGAMIRFVSGEKLPAIEALER